MTTPFDDQKKFMLASGQTVDRFNPDQFNMYLSLMEEESQELVDEAKRAKRRAKK